MEYRSDGVHGSESDGVSPGVLAAVARDAKVRLDLIGSSAAKEPRQMTFESANGEAT